MKKRNDFCRCINDKWKDGKEPVIIPINPMFVRKEQYCSENALSTILATVYGKHVDQEELNKSGCYDIFTISKCLPGFTLVPVSVDLMEGSIDAGYPIIASIIPDSNLHLRYAESLHSVVVYGYSDDRIFYIDAESFGSEKHPSVARDAFFKIWSRNNFLGYVKNDLIPRKYPSK